MHGAKLLYTRYYIYRLILYILDICYIARCMQIDRAMRAYRMYGMHYIYITATIHALYVDLILSIYL